jgi:hypothetical protein
MQYIPLIMVLLASLITLIISLVKNFEIIFSLKILSIIIILFYIIGNIVKYVLTAILKMEDGKNEENEEQTEDGRADEQNDTSDKSGDDFEE